jgi:flagellar motor switch protein FliM
MFGSDGRFHTRVEGRDFTPTEQRIIIGILNVVFAEYEKAWKPVYEVEFEYVRSEMNTQFANIATPSEIVVAFTFTIELSGNSAEMHLCLPYSMIEPIRDVLYSTMHSEQAGSDQRWTGMLRRQLLAAEVELTAPLGGTQIKLGEVAKLKVGDVVPFNLEDLLSVKVDGVPLLECRYGINNGQYALKIENFVAPEATE